MRKTKFRFIIILILVIMAISATGCQSISPPSVTTRAPSALSGIFSQQSTGIWVTGEGKVSVIPDVAVLSLGVQAQSASVAEAQSQAAAAMTAVVAELDNFGIAKKDIQTRHFSIAPLRRWSDQEAKEVLIGYQVTNTVVVKVRKVKDTGALIDAAARAGGDLIVINSISFTVDDPAPYYQEVREKAMADAQAKAKQLADLGGVRLGKPTYINESGISMPVVREYYAPVPAPAPAFTTPISAGETEIQLSVQVVYGIE